MLCFATCHLACCSLSAHQCRACPILRGLWLVERPLHPNYSKSTFLRWYQNSFLAVPQFDDVEVALQSELSKSCSTRLFNLLREHLNADVFYLWLHLWSPAPSLVLHFALTKRLEVRFGGLPLSSVQSATDALGHWFSKVLHDPLSLLSHRMHSQQLPNS